VAPVVSRDTRLEGVVLTTIALGGKGSLARLHRESNSEFLSVVGRDEDLEYVVVLWLADVAQIKLAGACLAGELFVDSAKIGVTLEVDGVARDGAHFGRGGVKGHCGLFATVAPRGANIADQKRIRGLCGLLKLDGSGGSEGKSGNSRINHWIRFAVIL
jgi:hypothetical protein